MAKQGIITKKDVIEEEALKWGGVYAEQVQQAINKNKEFAKSTLLLIDALKGIKGSSNILELGRATEYSNKVAKDGLGVWKEQVQLENQLISTKKRLELASESTNRTLIKERYELQVLNKQLKQEFLERTVLLMPYEKLNKARTDAKNKLRDLVSAESASTAELKKAQQAFEVLDVKVKKADRAVGDFTKNVGNYPQLKTFTAGIKDLFGAFGVVGGVTAFALLTKDIFNSTKELNSMNIALKTVTNGEQDLANQKEFLTEIAEKNGLEIKSLTKTYSQFYISAKDKLSGKEIQNIFDKVSKSASLMGLSVDQQTGAFLALQQMMSKGKVTAEELRGQLGERLPGAFGIMAKSMNITEAQLDKMMKDGKVIASEVLPKFADELAKTYGADNVRRIESIASSQNRMSNEWTKFVEDTSGGVTSKISATFQFIADNFRAIAEVAIKGGLIVGAYFGVLKAYNLVVGFGTALTTAYTFAKERYIAVTATATVGTATQTVATNALGTATAVATAETTALNIATKATPWGMILGLVAGLGAGLYFLAGANKKTNDETVKLVDTSLQKIKVDKEDLAYTEKLVKRYEELRGKTKLNNDEKKELKELTQKLTNQVPESVAGINKEIEAFDLKGEALKRYIKIKKDQLSLEKDSALKTNTEQRIKLLKEERNLININTKGGSSQIEGIGNVKNVKGEKKIEEYRTESSYQMAGTASMSNTVATLRNLTKEEQSILNKRYLDNQALLAKTLIQRKKIQGVEDKEIEPTKQTVVTGASAVDNTTSKKDNEKAIKDKLEAKKKLADSEFELEKQSIERSIKINDEIANDDSESDAVRIKALYASQQEQEDLLLLTKNNLLKNTELTANERLKIEEDYSYKVIDLDKKTAKEVEKINEFDLAKYTKELDTKISEQNIAMNSEITAEHEKVQKILDNEELSRKEKEKAIKEHEKAIFEIKKKYALDALKLQIDSFQSELNDSDKLVGNEALTVEKRRELQEKLNKTIEEYNALKVNNTLDSNSKIVESEKELTTKITELSMEMYSSIKDLVNTVFDAKIQKIDEEIAKNNEHYDKEIESAGKNETSKQELEKKRDKKNEELEKKKREEQKKAAIANKIFAIADIAIKTAQAIMAANVAIQTMNAATFGVAGTAYGAFAIPAIYAIAGIQAAAVLASPLPKYKHGRMGGKEEYAIVGDGGRSEVIERANGLVQMTPSTDTLVKLEKGDNVHSSIEHYYSLQKASILASIDMEGRRLTKFQETQMLDSYYSKELLQELKENTRAIKNQKNATIVNVPKIDFSSEIWKLNNKNWI